MDLTRSGRKVPLINSSVDQNQRRWNPVLRVDIGHLSTSAPLVFGKLGGDTKGMTELSLCKAVDTFFQHIL